MGKKYIVEIGRLERLYKAFINAYGKPEITWLSPEVDLTPYTAPDLEQVKKEAYEKGYENGFVDGHLKAEKSGQKFYEDGYKRGLSDAWEAATKILKANWRERNGTFGAVTLLEDIFLDNTPAEAIEKIRQYEQEQEEQITKGDIVLIKSTPEVEILVTYADEEYVSGIALTEVDGNCEIGDQYTNIRISNVEKTGKHYDIVSVLQKMREE